MFQFLLAERYFSWLKGFVSYFYSDNKNLYNKFEFLEN